MIVHVKTRPRLFISIALAVALWLVLPGVIRESTRMLISYDTAAALYLAMVFWMMRCATPQNIRKHAAIEDEGRFAILLFSSITAVASLAAIVAELTTAKDLTGAHKGGHIGLAAATVFLSWTFLHTMFALHYAHEYYSETDKDDTAGGLDFNQKTYCPNYWDFTYFAFMIGTTGATADVNISSPTMRHTATMHCMLSFFFNTTVLALMVNIGASLF